MSTKLNISGVYSNFGDQEYSQNTDELLTMFDISQQADKVNFKIVDEKFLYLTYVNEFGTPKSVTFEGRFSEGYFEILLENRKRGFILFNRQETVRRISLAREENHLRVEKFVRNGEKIFFGLFGSTANVGTVNYYPEL